MDPRWDRVAKWGIMRGTEWNVPGTVPGDPSFIGSRRNKGQRLRKNRNRSIDVSGLDGIPIPSGFIHKIKNTEKFGKYNQNYGRLGHTMGQQECLISQ